MKIYLASRYSRREELKRLADVLVKMGHTVTSRWLETEWVNRPDQSSAAPPEYRAKYAMIDLQDIYAADLMINFTEDCVPNAGRGGRHVEFGYAMALGKRLMVVGYRENLFHEHPSVEFFNSVPQMLSSLECTEVNS